jgi:hypothetical protein
VQNQWCSAEIQAVLLAAAMLILAWAVATA